MCYLEPLRKTSPNSRKHRTSSPVSLLVTRSPQSCSSHTVLQQLHWLPSKHRTDFKIANITFRTLHCSHPAYLRSSLHACHSTRSLRLSNTNLLSAPFVRISFGSRRFSVVTPKIWISLPLSLCTCTSPDTFRRHLKTHYCQQAFQATYPLSSSASELALLTIVYIYKLLYLLVAMLQAYPLPWGWSQPSVMGSTALLDIVIRSRYAAVCMNLYAVYRCNWRHWTARTKRPAGCPWPDWTNWPRWSSRFSWTTGCNWATRTAGTDWLPG